LRLRSVAQPGQEAKKEYVHMLNSTLSATERTLCCVLENYQTPEGVRIPDVLKPFMAGVEFIPFRKMYDPKGKLVDRPAPKPTSSAMST
jgi:seryl-tRNA synthetase